MTSAVQLVQALGGGWQIHSSRHPAEVGAKTTDADYKMQP